MAEYVNKAIIKDFLVREGCDNDLIKMIDCIQPSIVICKDCKFYKDEKSIFVASDWEFHKVGKCSLWEKYGSEEIVTPDYFCGNGKLIESDGTNCYD